MKNQTYQVNELSELFPNTQTSINVFKPKLKDGGEKKREKKFPFPFIE